MAEPQGNKKTFTLKSSVSNFIKSALEGAAITEAVITMGFIPISTGFLQPGDVIAFNYRPEGGSEFSPVVALVVQTKLSSGTRISRGTGNRLLTCFKIENDQDSKDILKRLYKNRVKSSIQRTSRMFGWLHKESIGDESYRTYIMNSAHVRNMMELTLDKEEI